MEQLRQVGEALGGVQALMSFADDDLHINPRQCRLLADACAQAFSSVSGEVRAHLRLGDRHARWKPLESPLRELLRAVRDAEAYVRHCLDPPRDRDGRWWWWARAAAATHGAECVELHMHGLLWSVAVVLEAVEDAAAATGPESVSDADEVARQRRRLLFGKDYDRDMLEPALFRHRLGARHLATRELAARMDAAAKEDRWLLSQHLEDRRNSSSPVSSPDQPPPLTRSEQRLAELLTAPRGKVHPASLLQHGGGAGSGDFHLRRRLPGNLKEVQWLGESFAVKHLVGADAEAAVGGEAAVLTSVAHPNVAHCRYVFHDEERREVFLVMDQLMTRDLAAHVKEAHSSAKRKVAFPLAVAVDVMLQVARGMEYLHAKGIFHGDLNPSNVLVRTRQQHAAGDPHLHVKVAGFAQSTATLSSSSSAKPSPRKAAAAGNNNNNNSSSSSSNNNNNNNSNPCIWYAPEVLEQGGEAGKRAEKADVYSFGMLCFEVLTGKIPFEDNHLQGEHMSKNIRAGERPLFPFQAPKYLTSLTKRCWHGDPAQRPSFASLCRVLRYVKRFLAMNNPPTPEQQQQTDAAAAPPPVVPAVDYFDVEASLLRRFPAWGAGTTPPRVADVPFQMFAYRVVEKERTRAAILQIGGGKDKASDSSSDGNSLCGDEVGSATLSDGDALSVSSRGTATATFTTRPLPDRAGSRKASPSDRAGSRKASPRKVDGSRIAGSRLAAGTTEKSKLMEKSKSMGVVRPPQIIRRTQRIKSDGHLKTAAVPSPRRRASGSGSGGGHASDSELA